MTSLRVKQIRVDLALCVTGTLLVSLDLILVKRKDGKWIEYYQDADPDAYSSRDLVDELIEMEDEEGPWCLL